MPQCAVATCRNSHRRTRGRRIRYHRFPQIPEVRSLWVRACGRIPLSNGEVPFNIQTARICSLHFTNESYEKDMEHLVLGLPVRSRLRRGAVPTIGVPVSVEPVTKMLVEDAKRSLLKVAHAKMLTSQKVTTNGIGYKETKTNKSKYKQRQTNQQQKQNNTHNQQQRQHSIPCDDDIKNITEFDVLLALGLKPCLNKMHAMDESGAKKLESAEMKKDEDDFSRKSPQVPQSQQNGAALPEETAAAAADRLHSAVVKEEPFMESVTDTAKNSTTDSAISKKSEGIRSRKRRSTEETISTNGNSVMKKVCVEQRDQLVSSLITGYENASADELATRADVLRAELQALDELARAAEMEWNRVLTMRKLKEEAFLRIERRRQVINFMEGHDRLSDMLPPSNLILEGDLEGRKMEMRQGNAIMKDKSGFSSRDEHGDNSVSQDIGLFKNDKKSNLVQNFANRNLAEAKKQAEALAENRQIGEGRQGPIVDVRSIIADYRLRHPETVPRRGRRMRNSVNIGLGAGGAMVETGQNVDSRPSSTDSCKSNSNTDTNNSMSFKDVLVQFAKLSQQQGEAVKTPQNYPDVTLHPVAPSPTQTPTPQQTGSLLHGILTKAQSPRPTTFSPTLARLLTAPERERNIPVPTTMAPTTTPTTNVMPHTNSRSQRLLQTYQETNPVSISDLLSSSKGRTEITITPVVNPSVQSHVNNMMHVDDDEETSLMEERESRISGGNRDDRDISPRCQGCHERAAQYVCAGCGNQWYCSPECQAAAWDEHSEVCSG